MTNWNWNPKKYYSYLHDIHQFGSFRWRFLGVELETAGWITEAGARTVPQIQTRPPPALQSWSGHRSARVRIGRRHLSISIKFTFETIQIVSFNLEKGVFWLKLNDNYNKEPTKQSISKRTPDASLPRCGFKFGGMFVFHQASITSLSNQDSFYKSKQFSYKALRVN